MYEVLTATFFAFLLGLRHATEPDHILTVSSIVSQMKDQKKASVTGLLWGMGHTTTLFLFAVIALMLHVTLSLSIFHVLETVVGTILIFLGLRTCVRAFKLHSHSHKHDSVTHTHPHSKHSHRHHASFLIGAVHGLAGSGSIIVLVASSFSNIYLGLLYVFFFRIRVNGRNGILQPSFKSFL